MNFTSSHLKAESGGIFCLYGIDLADKELSCMQFNPEKGWSQQLSIAKGILIDGLKVFRYGRNDDFIIWREKERFKTSIKYIVNYNVSPPCNLVAVKHVEVFPTEVINIVELNWKASEDEDVDRYNIYSNGHYIGFVKSSDSCFRIISPTQKEEVILSVTAMAKDGRESLATTVNFSY